MCRFSVIPRSVVSFRAMSDARQGRQISFISALRPLLRMVGCPSGLENTECLSTCQGTQGLGEPVKLETGQAMGQEDCRHLLANAIRTSNIGRLSAFRISHSALRSAFVPSYLRTPLPLMFIPHSAFSIPHSEDSAFRTPHSALEQSIRTLVCFLPLLSIPHSELRIPHWSSPFVPSYLRTPLPLMFIPHSAFSIPHSEDSAFRTPHFPGKPYECTNVPWLSVRRLVAIQIRNPQSAIRNDKWFRIRVPLGCSEFGGFHIPNSAIGKANYQSLTPKTAWAGPAMRRSEAS